MQKKKYYVTTPIFYVNDKPHIGHAYTAIAADVVGRFMEISDCNVYLLSGTDEHGQKIQKSAAMIGKNPQDFVDDISKTFLNLLVKLNVKYNDFIRTTEKRHKDTVSSIWLLMLERGYIYKGKYSGWYSVRDESFYLESDLVDGIAPTGSKVEWIEEDTYFFALSKFQNRLLEFYDSSPNFVKPKFRYNEVINFVQSGLDDLSISRTTLNWGIDVPNAKNHKVYVWLDALLNYISAIGYPTNHQTLWPADIHIIGKDILRFHAIYWPAFLMAIDLQLPSCIFAHGWWTNNGEKMSKSIGNTIDPIEIIDKFGLDQFRYFLMREITFGQDGDFSEKNLINRMNSDLANKLGNLVQRMLSFLHKNYDGVIPQLTSDEVDAMYLSDELICMSVHTARIVVRLLDSVELSKILDNIFSLIEYANGYVDRKAPWRLKSTNDEREMAKPVYTTLEAIRYIAIMLYPYMPDSSKKILDMLDIDIDHRFFRNLNKDFALRSRNQLPQPKIVFNKFNTE